MSAQIGRDQNLPAACKRCGGLLYENFEFCPYCGTDCPLDKVALGTHPKATLTPLGATAATPPAPAAAKFVQAGVPATDGPSLDAGYPHAAQHTVALLHGLRVSQMGQWIFPRGLFVFALIVAFAYGTYLLLGANRQREANPRDETLHFSGGSVSTNASTQQAGETPPAAGRQTSEQPQSTPRNAHPVPQFADVAEALRVARTSLAENNLFDANAAANAVLARDGDNEEARALQNDIAARMQRRDSALQNADRCVAQHAWACVQQQASEALAIDSSSQAAQSLMERAIVSTAWKPLSPPSAAPQTNAAAALPRGANTVRLPSSQDWNTSASPPPLPGAINTANAANVATAASPSGGDNSVDVQERAIVQNGWKRAAPSGATH
ncbi:zinc ribbon domain-containing protein [Paraburkholderia sp. CNPSo 3272]|uniref:zinc ribbon domain-containing protein n=1 Tax=Paraburkholderia sp. CNPSo 3272 TaxID=2940931 RepID=UPI0020B84A21|nr:zinc ribbon domain-containing protein [Paraburkholderia sp. CNPSo 3272]MCP3726074.1 zinc ribbon domain-containing protein [Paraburkholderia sp. CNPSo 3272]